MALLRGKREFRRRWRWLWVLLAAVLAVGIFGGALAYRAYREWMDEIIWDSSQWEEGFSYWRTLHTTDGEDIGPALEALEELQADGPVQLKSREEAAAFDERFGAYGLEPVGEYDFSESWLWVTGCVMPVGVWLEDEAEGLRAVLVTPPRGGDAGWGGSLPGGGVGKWPGGVRYAEGRADGAGLIPKISRFLTRLHQP